MSSTAVQTSDLIQGHQRNAKIPHIADFKSAYISLIIDPRGLACKTNL